MLDHKSAVQRILEEAAPNPLDDWRHEKGILKGSVRLDIPLHDPQQTLHILRYMSEELPRIALAIEREDTPLDRRIVADSRLTWLRGKIRGRR